MSPSFISREMGQRLNINSARNQTMILDILHSTISFMRAVVVGVLWYTDLHYKLF